MKKENTNMKNGAKIVIGVGAAVAAISAFTAGVVYQLKAIKKITTDADDALPEEILEEEAEVVAEEAVEAEVVADAE